MENVIIIGSGPAACTAALYTARANLSPLMFEGELSKDVLPGGQLMTTTEVENYPGFPGGISGPEMMDLFKKQATRFDTRVESRTITKVDLTSRPFKVFAGDDSWETKGTSEPGPPRTSGWSNGVGRASRRPASPFNAAR